MTHFVFWGLFVAAAAIVAGYVVWMRITEQNGEARENPDAGRGSP